MGRKFTIFALFYFVFEGKFQVQAPQGAYIRRGDLTKGFLRYDLEGLILRYTGDVSTNTQMNFQLVLVVSSILYLLLWNNNNILTRYFLTIVSALAPVFLEI